MNKKYSILISAIFALNHLQIYAAEEAFLEAASSRTTTSQPSRRVSTDVENKISVQEASTAAHFQASSQPYSGKITGISINPKTSSSTITEQISQQLSTPLSSQERSLLTKAFDKARSPITDSTQNGKQWDAVNAQLEKILTNRPGSQFTEHQFLDALSAAEKTSTFANVINKISTFFSHLTTSGKELSTEHQGVAITFSDPKVTSAIAKNNATKSLQDIDALISKIEAKPKQTSADIQKLNELNNQRGKLANQLHPSSIKPTSSPLVGFKPVAEQTDDEFLTTLENQNPEVYTPQTKEDSALLAELDQMTAQQTAQELAAKKSSLYDPNKPRPQQGGNNLAFSNLEKINKLDGITIKRKQLGKDLSNLDVQVATVLDFIQKPQDATKILGLQSNASKAEHIKQAEALLNLLSAENPRKIAANQSNQNAINNLLERCGLPKLQNGMPLDVFDDIRFSLMDIVNHAKDIVSGKDSQLLADHQTFTLAPGSLEPRPAPKKTAPKPNTQSTYDPNGFNFN